MKRSRLGEAAERDAANPSGDAGNGEVTVGLGFGSRDDGGARPVPSGGGSGGGIGSSHARLLAVSACIAIIVVCFPSSLVCLVLSPLQLLQKAGWHEGRGLGVAEQGRLDPVPPSLKFDKVGLGGPSSSHVPFSSSSQSAPALSHIPRHVVSQPHTAQSTTGIAGSGFSRAVSDALDNDFDVGAGASASDADGGKSRSARRRQKKQKAGQQAEKEQMLQQWLYREFFPDNV
ncbi:unnamed protein product [Closterium sp. Yama58-4]|nr:unnamed protein product [Closterium sp. Yama58-4]